MFGDDDVNSFLHKSRVMVFQPTLEEFRDFSKYVEHMEECGAAEWGIAKVGTFSVAIDNLLCCFFFFKSSVILNNSRLLRKNKLIFLMYLDLEF